MRGSAYADSIVAGFQDPENSFMHAMTSESIPNKAEACRLANQFIKENLDKFHDLLSGPPAANPSGRRGDTNLRNTPSGPYFALGMAMHTVMDSTSPSHTGFQYWDNSQVSRHGPDSLGMFSRKHTEEGLSALLSNPSLMNHTLDLMSRALGGNLLECSCQ